MEQTEPGEREIDLKDMLWKILKSYRLLLILAVIFAVVFGAFGIVSSAGTESEKTEEVIEEESMARDDLYDSLSSAEKLRLDQVEQVYEQLNQMTSEYEEDPVRNVDPYQITDISLQFYIRAYDEVTKDGTGIRSYVEDLQVAYGLLVREEDVLADLAEIMGIGTEKYGYVSDYISTRTNGSGGIQVHILYDDADTAREMADYLITAMEQGENELSKNIGEHEIILIADTSTKGYNESIDQIQTERMSFIDALNDSLEDALDDLSDKAVEVYEYDTDLIVREEDKNEVSSAAEETKRSYSVILYILVGFVGGILLGCVIVALRYLFDGKIKTEEDVQTILGSGYFGALAKEDADKKRLFGGIDRRLFRFQYRNILHGTREEQKTMTAKNFGIFCRKKGISSVYLSVEENEEEKNLAEQFSSFLKEEGISVSFGGNILLNEEALRQMAGCGSILFFCETEKSRYGEIEAQANLARALDVSLLGAVTII